NVFAFISWSISEFAASPCQILYAATSIGFDLSIFEIFYPLSVGVPIRLLKDGLEIKKNLVKDQKVMLNTVPSVINFLLEEKEDLSTVSVLNVAREQLTKHIVDKLDVEKMEIPKLYGPTEDTNYSTRYRIKPHRQITIG